MNTDDAEELELLTLRSLLRRIHTALAEGDTVEAKKIAERGVNLIGRTLEMEEERRQMS